MMRGAEYWIKQLNLVAHPEGGYYRESYRGTMQCTPEGFDGSRNISTSIYYLLRAGDVSHLHRIRSDEVWHFYCGAALTIHTLDQSGQYQKLLLGLSEDARPQQVVPAGQWFGAQLIDECDDSFALVGCTVAPGFDFIDFELAPASMIQKYPAHRHWMQRLIQPSS